MICPNKNDRYIVNGFGDDIYRFRIERVWFYEGKDKSGNGGDKNILNENAEPCDQHKICFKQDILKYSIYVCYFPDKKVKKVIV